MASEFRQLPPARIRGEVYDRLTALAKSDDRSVSDVLCLMIADWLAAHPASTLAETSQDRTANSAKVETIRRKVEQT